MVNVAILSATAWEMMHKMADVKWIKITTDIFDDEKILLIESLPEADSIIVIWFKLLCLAGKMNNSGVFIMNDKIAYTDKMLATIFRRKEATVQMALKTFEQFGMVEIVDGVITIPNWNKHQSLDALEKKREYQKELMRKRREEQKRLCEANSETNSETNSDANVSRLDKEEEREEEQDKIRDKESIYTSVISYLNEKAGTKYRATTPKTQALIRAREREGFTLDDFKAVIDKKCAEWMGRDMEKYLRPETLFGPKFEGYLNEKGRGKNGISGGSAPSDSEEVAKRVGTWL